MRRFLAILLLLAFGMPLFAAASAAGSDPESNLPACCRRNGQHHCAMSMAERTAVVDSSHHWRAPMDGCPYCPASVATAHADTLHPPTTAQAIFAGLLSHPTLTPQTESWCRIARDRSRHKRGPPQLFLL